MAHSFMNKCESGERAIVVVELWALANIYGKAISCFAPISYKANKPKEPLFLLNPQRVCRNPKAGIGNVIWGGRRTVLSSLTYVRTNSLTNLDLLSARAAICRSKHRLGSSRSRVIGPPWATLIAPAFVRNATPEGRWLAPRPLPHDQQPTLYGTCHRGDGRVRPDGTFGRVFAHYSEHNGDATGPLHWRSAAHCSKQS
jgi:hypothetical protein